MTEAKSVAVLLGGISNEREVSLVSGNAVVKALESRGYDVRKIDLGKDLAAVIKALDPVPDVVFNALHGRYGEDGTIQGMLELMQIPYTHSGVMASALAMDKPMAKKLFAIADIPCAEHVLAGRDEILAGDVLPRPYVIKPINEGSSVGVQIISDAANTPSPSDCAWQFGEKVMVEQYIPGRELTVAIMGDRPLGVTELRPKAGFYDFEAKYTDGKTDHILPADIPEEAAEAAMEYSLAAHRVLGCRGVTRADLRYDDTNGPGGQIYMLELNTQPGLTPLSLVPEQAAHHGIEFPDLVSWMVENAACDA